MARPSGAAASPRPATPIAFLNAGVYFIAERDKFSADVVWRTFEINVGGTVNCLDPVLAAMEKRGNGQIALNASLAGYGGIEGSLAYGSTKAALIYMAEPLASLQSVRPLRPEVAHRGGQRLSTRCDRSPGD